MIYVTTVDIRGDLTHTMPLTVFLSAFEPNLAVFCASIPMLRPCYTRFRRRHESKYASPNSKYSNGYDRSGKKGGGSSNLSRSRGAKGGVELDTIHILEHGGDLKGKGVESGADGTSLDGSVEERRLTPELGSMKRESGIQVETQWSVSHD
jgi:hypothetical protein